MKDTLIFIIKSIVEKDDKVDVTEEENQGIVNFTVKVDPEEMGKVIGKEGKVIKAIRNIMRIPGVLQNKKIYITLAE
ncbi:MAG: KH domain-containing protein [Patescibacteria group bacterium]